MSQCSAQVSTQPQGGTIYYCILDAGHADDHEAEVELWEWPSGTPAGIPTPVYWPSTKGSGEPT